MKILITGGAGYLGSVLTKVLLDAGHIVTVLDNFTHRVPSLSHLSGHPMLEIVRGDCQAYNPMVDLVDKAEVLIPLAAVVGAPACDADRYRAQAVNVTAVEALCSMASKDHLIIYPNTNSGYGIGGKEMCTEDDQLMPISIYGVAKAAAERHVLRHPEGFSLRFATLFGASPRMRLDLMVNDFVYRAVRDKALILYEPHFRRNFLHVSDAAGAFLHIISHWSKFKDRVFNVGLSSANLTKSQLCELINRHVKDFCWHEAPVGTDPDKRDYIVSNARLEATGWKPQISLDYGIQELLTCYEQPFESYRNV